MKKRYRIKSKYRFTLFVAIMLVLVISMVGTFTGNNTVESLTKVTYAEVQVEPGDTLWDLAKSFGPPDQDLRKVVFEICKINHVSADTIYPGQTLRIPLYI